MRRKKIYARDALREHEALQGLSAKDRALAWRLVLGTTAARGSLEALLGDRLSRPKRLEPRVFDALKLAAFELMYLKTPVPVAVSEGVALVRGVRPQAAGLANAILRKLTPMRDEVRRARAHLMAGRFEAGELALVSGMPLWLAARILCDLGSERASAFGLCTLEPAPVWVVALSSRASEARLKAAGLDPEREELPGIWRLHNPTGLEASGVLERDFAPEDLSAYGVALLSAVFAGASRLEVGVGRGTKALVSASRFTTPKDRGLLVGVDASAERLAQAKRRFDAAGIDAELILGDGRHLASLLPQKDAQFDEVFVDAPCSGTGTLRRHPEIAWSLEPQALDMAKEGSLCRLQYDLLQAASEHVAPGGVLAYATCSVMGEENARQVARFLASPLGRHFYVEAPAQSAIVSQLPPKACAFVQSHTTSEGFFATTPLSGHPDGHFFARLVRHRL